MYTTLRDHFVQKKPAERFQNALVFRNEVQLIIDGTPFGREERSIVCGIAVAGPLIAVNTRQLKSLIGRCKSSINGSFRQLGYLAVKTKSKARECVLVILPSLKGDPGSLRQWTVRFSSAGPLTLPTVVRAHDLTTRARPDSATHRINQHTPEERMRQSVSAGCITELGKANDGDSVLSWVAEEPMPRSNSGLCCRWFDDSEEL
jgi:hypothetical protein